jgi:hypothetical protein
MKIGRFLSSKTFALFVASSGNVIFGTHKTWQQNFNNKEK